MRPNDTDAQLYCGRPSTRSSVIRRDPILRLGDPDFLFDLVYIMGYISYRYGSAGENYNISPL